MPTALILGATSDIGFAVARKFASEKYNIQLTARNKEDLRYYQTDLEQRYSVSCHSYAFDAKDFNAHASFFQNLEPKPDVTVYVIGYMTENEIAINNWNESLQTINANYTGAVSILNIIAAHYIIKGAGTIVGISSVAGVRGRQSNYIYGSAKAAFTAYLSGLRNKLFSHNIHVVTVLPGFVYTKMTEHLNLPKIMTARPEEVAEVVWQAVRKKQDVVYVKWFWKWIMQVIDFIPETIFKKKKL